MQAEVPDAEGDRAGLVELGEPVPVVEGPARLRQVVAEAAEQFGVAVLGLLVVGEQRGVGRESAADGAPQGGVGGRALEAEFGDEAGDTVRVGAVVGPVPDVPDSHAARTLMALVTEGSAAGFEDSAARLVPRGSTAPPR
ncbi:hypothetical protein ACFRCW_24570 [Streptomyces sp. NPDC056653]|uniref:hypothetical protein n=1 Tax=Streptomyces sp. NPDC056653 TaxID=3345894 RepID=UPI0036A31D93